MEGNYLGMKKFDKLYILIIIVLKGIDVKKFPPKRQGI